MKRVILFVLTNVLVVVTISLVMNLLGVKPYLTAYGLDYQALLIFCSIWGFAGSFISLAISKFMAKQFMGVKILDPHGQGAELVNRVHRLAKAAGIEKMPEVGFYNSPEVNAFATGPSKNNSLVAVSSGLLNSMNNDEVEGVLAHEVAHIANGDMVTMALVQGVINAFVMFFARVAAFAIQNAMRSDDRDSAVGGISYWITTMVFEFIFGFLGMFVVAFFSRYREYRADSGGARLAGRDKMIAALKRLKYNMEHGGVFEKGNENMQAFKISSKGGLMAFLSTHPSLDDRIKALELGR